MNKIRYPTFGTTVHFGNAKSKPGIIWRPPQRRRGLVHVFTYNFPQRASYVPVRLAQLIPALIKVWDGVETMVKTRLNWQLLR
jgi:hypothetical protein